MSDTALYQSSYQPCHPVTLVTPVTLVIHINVVTPSFLFRNRIVYLVYFSHQSLTYERLDNIL